MKVLPWVAFGSLAANAALLGMVIRTGSSFKAQDDARVAAERARLEAAAATKSSAPEAETVASTMAKIAQSLLKDPTKSFSTADLKTFADQLRAAGFPASAIRSIITALVNEPMMQQYRELQKEQMGTRKYWSNQSFYSGMINKEAMAKSRALTEERTRQLTAVLGENARDDNAPFYEMQYGKIAPAKIARLQKIIQDYSEMRSEIHMSSQGIFLPEDNEKLAFIEKEQLADLNQLLSPEERFEYEVRSSTTSSMLKSRLGSFSVTEDEFRAIFKEIQDKGVSTSSPFMGSNRGEYEKFSSALNEAAKSILPADRMSDFQLASDPRYGSVGRLVARLELPPTTTRDLVSIQEDSMKQMSALRSNRELTAEQRNAQIQTLQQNVTSQLKTMLKDDRGFDAYKQYGGQWLQMLNPSTGGPRTLPAFGGAAVPLPKG